MKLVLPLLGFLMLSGTLMSTAYAPAWPSLPLTTVQLTVVDGTTSYFISTLSGVPAGFDVHNGAYPGWCIDRSVTMVRSVAHNVKLVYPSIITAIWRAVNYILNHKQGTMMDVQNAIWHFTDNYTPSGGFSVAAQAMIDAADANPTYDPMTGDILAIICLPQDTSPAAQDSIIELTKPPLESGYTPGFWKHNIGVALDYSNGAYSAFNDGTKLTLTMLQGYAATVGVTLEDAYEALSAHGFTGADMVRADMANAFNAAAGYGPFED